MAKPVIVVGAGPAGIVCARRLHEAGVYVLLLDAGSRPGGRLKTDEVDGFKLDRGFQIYLDAYPNASRELDYERLELGNFDRGAVVFHDGKLNTIEEKRPLAAFLDRFLPKKDKKLVMNLREEAHSSSAANIFRARPMRSDKFLQGHGFSDAFFEKFANPFFRGVFLDHELKEDSRNLMFVFKMLADGHATLPKGGMEAIPQQLLEGVPRYLLRMDHKVTEVLRQGGRAVGVRLDTSEVLDAEAVVLATDALTASKLSGLATVDGSTSTTCLYFETPMPCVDQSLLVLNGTGKGRVNHVAPLTNAQPGYAPKGKHLASATIIDDVPLSDEELVAETRKELEAWFPDKGVNMWRHLRTYRIPYAHLPQPVGTFERMPNNETEVPGLFFAGEFTENGSIDGAVRSGNLCAEKILAATGATEAA